MSLIAFLRANARWLAAGFVMALASSFGQTFFIALYSEPLRLAFDLSHGAFGTIYMLGTLLSAATLVQLGRLADIVPPRRLALLVVLALAAICLAMASVATWWLLIPVVFGLRLFGQGMISHLSQTCMARWFNASRGRALSIASLGYPTGEALLPLVAVALIGLIGWRQSWLLAALTLIVAVAPLLAWLLAKKRTPQSGDRQGDEVPGMAGRHWSRRHMLRHPLFFLLLPGILGPGFLITVVFFLASHIANVKGWPIEAMAARYWVYALCSVGAALVSGLAIDRFSARACLPFYQVPLAISLVVIAFGQTPASIAAILGLCGLTAGAAATVHAALWAELYGTRHIGAIKALAHSVMVFASAAGPGVTGLIIDAGVPFPDQALWFAFYTLGVCALYGWLVLSGQTRTTR